MSNRILIITQWFDPEPTFKGLLFAKELVKRGHEVEVLTGFPNYPGGKIYPGYKIKLIQKEKIDGVSIVRLPLFPSHNNRKIGRIANYVSFAISVIFYGVFFVKKPNVIYSYHPPLTVGIASVIIKFFRRTPIVYDIQDLWPDTLEATDMINSKKLLKAISWACDQIYKSVDKIVVLSPGFKLKLMERNIPSTKLEVIYNWADEEILRSHNAKLNFFKEEKNNFNILFAGNIGRAQKLEVVLEAAKILLNDHPMIKFIFLGNGISLDALKKQSKKMQLSNIIFMNEVPMHQVGIFLESADVLLIHLKKNKLFEITIPGKTQAYMSIGKPIIIGVKGDASDLINNAKCGITIESENAEELAEADISLENLSEEEMLRLGHNARDFYDKNLSVKRGVDKFSYLFNKVIS